MGKAGTKQKRKPKLTDKKQSERFKEIARNLRADEAIENFEVVFRKIVPSKTRQS